MCLACVAGMGVLHLERGFLESCVLLYWEAEGQWAERYLPISGVAFVGIEEVAMSSERDVDL